MKTLCNSRYVTVFFLIIFSVFLLFAGCTININVGNSSSDIQRETISDHDGETADSIAIYQSRVAIYISNTGTSGSHTISSADLDISKELIETYVAILQSNRIQDQIRKEYPGVEYELTLEQIEETGIFVIIATGEGPEKLEEICNMAASLFCEEGPSVIEGISCKVVDYAEPAQQVGTN